MSESAVVGAFALGGAALGAAITLAGVYARWVTETRRERRAAARLLIDELTTNQLTIEDFGEHRGAVPHLRDDAWKSVRSTVASGLTEEEFLQVAACYSHLTLMRSLIALPILLWPLQPLLNAIFGARSRKVATSALEDIDAALAILEAHC